MFGYINNGIIPIPFKKVYYDSGKWLFDIGTLKAYSVKNTINIIGEGHLTIIVEDPTPHECRMMRRFMLAVFGGKS